MWVVIAVCLGAVGLYLMTNRDPKYTSEEERAALSAFGSMAVAFIIALLVFVWVLS